MKITLASEAQVVAWGTAAPGWPIGAACFVLGYPAYVVAAADRGKVRVRFPGGSPGEDLPDEIDVSPDDLTRPPGAAYLNLNLDDWRGKWRQWASRDLAELHLVWGTAPEAEIAARFGRTVDACRIALWRWYGSKAAKGDLLSGQGVARILGVDVHYVTGLIRSGLLRGRRRRLGGSGPRFKWVVSEECLETFLRDHPTRYYPDRVTGVHWRQVVAEIHATDPFLTTEAAAKLLCIEPNSVLQRIYAGDLLAARGLRDGRFGEAPWLVRRSDVLAWRDRDRRRAPIYPDRDRAFAENGWLTPEEAARLLGVHRCTVYKWIRAGRLPERRILAHGKWFIGIPRSALGTRAATPIAAD